MLLIGSLVIHQKAFFWSQFVRVGIYHEINEKWALLGTVAWDDWSEMDKLTLSTRTPEHYQSVRLPGHLKNWILFGIVSFKEPVV